MKTKSIIFTSIIALVYAAFVIVFTTFPRSTVSELERRELAQFPAFSTDSLFSGAFTREVSAWFSDTEPYRDKFMEMSMIFSDNLKLKLWGDDQSITFHAANDKDVSVGDMGEDDEMTAELQEYTNTKTANADAKVAGRGIIIFKDGDNVRGVTSFRGGPEGGKGYAKVCNQFYDAFGPKVKIYCMIIPTACEFYTPDAARSAIKPQLPTIKNAHENLHDSVVAVNVYNPLASHVNEDIYLRTDHHWAPLGAYYAAKEFARMAHVPFPDLSTGYEKKVVHGYVGSLYGFSHDISIKNSPEDFVYYVPKNVTYSTTFINYKTSPDYKVIGESPMVSGEYFFTYPDGSGNAYCTFMGGDSKITHVHTSTANGRRLLIIKDSFGNALPGYLFYSFEDIHVIDFRYFSKNLKKYVAENNITDILLAANSTRAYSGGGEMAKFITQPDGTYNGLNANGQPITPAQPKAAKKKTGAKK